MKKYTVFAVYEDDLDQRFATHVDAKDPEEAEVLAAQEADAPIIVAGIVEGHINAIDRTHG